MRPRLLHSRSLRAASALLLGALLHPASGRAHIQANGLPAIFIEDGEFAGGASPLGAIRLQDGRALWSCDAGLETAPLWWHRAAGEVLLSGSFSGLFESRDGGCSWSPAEGWPEPAHTPSDIAADPSDPDSLYLTSAGGNAPNAVWHGEDGTWTELLPAPAGLRLTSIHVAPGGDPIRVTALDPVSGASALYRSDGGGPLTESGPDLGDRVLVRLLDVGDDGALWFSARRDDFRYALLEAAAGAPEPVEIASFDAQPTTLLHTPLGSFVATDDQRAHRDDGAGFTELPVGASCLAWEADRLWRCGAAPDRVLFAVSDDAESWEPLLRWEDLERGGCGALCDEDWETLRNIFDPPDPEPETGCDSAGGARCGQASGGLPGAALFPLLAGLLALRRGARA